MMSSNALNTQVHFLLYRTAPVVQVYTVNKIRVRLNVVFLLLQRLILIREQDVKADGDAET